MPWKLQIFCEENSGIFLFYWWWYLVGQEMKVDWFAVRDKQTKKLTFWSRVCLCKCTGIFFPCSVPSHQCSILIHSPPSCIKSEQLTMLLNKTFILEKAVIVQLPRRFFSFCGTQRFIMIVERACHWHPYSGKWIHSMSQHPTHSDSS